MGRISTDEAAIWYVLRQLPDSVVKLIAHECGHVIHNSDKPQPFLERLVALAEVRLRPYCGPPGVDVEVNVENTAKD